MAIVYAHIRLDNNTIFYIGRGVTERRSKSKTNRNPHWHNIVNKCGYKIKILWKSSELDSKEIAWKNAGIKEIEFIKKYGRKDIGLGKLVNMTDGGEGLIGQIYTDEYRKKLSESHIGIQCGNRHPLYGTKRSLETRQKISMTQTGKKLSDEHRKNISLGNKGRIVSTETRRKIGDGHRGKTISADARLKMSLAKIGKISNRLGSKASTESKNKMRDSHLGARWMNNGVNQSQVVKSKIDEYLSNGWTYGRLI